MRTGSRAPIWMEAARIRRIRRTGTTATTLRVALGPDITTTAAMRTGSRAPDLNGSSPNPADQAYGYNSHNTPGGGNYGGGGNDGGGGGGNDGDGGGGNDGGGGGGKPVLLDLDGDGVELVALEDSTAFYDIHGDGFRYHLSWVAPDDGLLAYDRDGDGRISERGEISFVDYVEGARTDLEGLRHFDTNRDNVLDSADREWSKFRVWQDLDQDGESDAGELRSLDEAGIRSITLASSGEVETRGDGTRVFGRGTYVGTDGRCAGDTRVSGCGAAGGAVGIPGDRGRGGDSVGAGRGGCRWVHGDLGRACNAGRGGQRLPVGDRRCGRRPFDQHGHSHRDAGGPRG